MLEPVYWTNNRCAAFNDPTSWKYDVNSDGGGGGTTDSTRELDSPNKTLRAEKAGKKLYRAFQKAVKMFDNAV